MPRLRLVLTTLALGLLFAGGAEAARHAPQRGESRHTAQSAPSGARHAARARAARPVARQAVRTAHAAARAPDGAFVQQGRASVYGPRFAGRRMANGAPFDPRAAVAAHRTLPLGTRARVTNLETGRSATVTVTDRGPHARGRVIDLSPGVAALIGMPSRGLARVEVAAMER